MIIILPYIYAHVCVDMLQKGLHEDEIHDVLCMMRPVDIAGKLCYDVCEFYTEHYSHEHVLEVQELALKGV